MTLDLKSARTHLFFWELILDSMVGVSARDQLRLQASAISDVLLCLNGTPPRMPIGRYACTVRAPLLDLVIHARANSDDLYLGFPFREDDVHRAILEPLRPGDVFVDVGANIGYYSILASRAVGPRGRVIAVEPVPSTFHQLQANIRTNRCENITPLDCSVWSTAGVLTLEVTENSYGEAHVVQPDGLTPVIGPVPARTLDEICRPLPHIRLIKLDIEDSELEALTGAPETLDKTDRLVVECCRNESEIASLLSAFGFELSRLSFGPYLAAARP